MKLIALYKAILEFASYAVTPDGYIKFNLGDNKENVVVDGKSLVLPIREQMAYLDRKSKVLFHPLMEDMTQDESAVSASYRQNLSSIMNLSFVTLLIQLAEFLASPATHKGLTPEQLQILEAVPELDANSLKVIVKAITEASEKDPSSTFFNMYVCRGGKFNGKTHGYVAVVTFTFYRDLVAGNYEHIIKGKHAKALKQLCEFMFPMIDEKDHYSFASEADFARCFDSVMGAFFKLVTRYKYLRELYKERLTQDPDLLAPDFNMDWLPDYEAKAELYGEVRMIQQPHTGGPAPMVREQAPQERGYERERHVEPEQPVATAQGLDYRAMRQQQQRGGRQDDRREDPRDFRDDRDNRRRREWADDDDYRRDGRDGRRGRGLSFRERVAQDERLRDQRSAEDEDVDTPQGWMPLYEARRRYPEHYGRIHPEDIHPDCWRRDPYAGRGRR